MKDLYTAARHLYMEAFKGEDPAFVDALFALGFPKHFVAIGDGGKLVSMLFSLPYPILTADGVMQARYLYAVATAAEYRGKGYAKQLLREVASRGEPVFLRPLSPSLFDFYKSAGFTPFSPYATITGKASTPPSLAKSEIRSLCEDEYLSARDLFLSPPYCRMTPAFLKLCFSVGGAIGLDGHFAALYEKQGSTVLFKEWFGDHGFLGEAAAFLGATDFKARFPQKDGAPFGVGVGIPEGTVFLSALD